MAEQWRAESPPRSGRYDWATIMTRLRTRPGEWMKVATQVNRSLPSAIRSGRITMLRDDPNWEYHVQTRKTSKETNKADIWMSATRRENSGTSTDNN